MSKKQRHRIKQQRIELSFDAALGQNKTLVQQTQTIISQRCQHAIIAILEKQFDGISNKDEIHRIDRFDINLGQIDLDHIESDFVQCFQTCLSEALAKQQQDFQRHNNQHSASKQVEKGQADSRITAEDSDSFKAEQPAQTSTTTTTQSSVQPSSPKTQQALSHKASQLELMQYFLRYGHLPWWADNHVKGTVKKAFSVCLELDTVSFQQFWQETTQRPITLKRLLRHIDKTDSLSFIQRYLQLHSEVQQIEIGRVIILAFLAVLSSAEQQDLLQYWITELKEQHKTGSAEFNVEVLLKLAKALEQEYLDYSNSQTPTLSFPHSSLGMHSKTLQRRAEEQAEDQDQAEDATLERRSMGSHAGAWEPEKPEESFALAREAGALRNAFPRGAWEREGGEEEYYIHNAGLVLLWPFLTPFFQTLALLNEEKGFIQPEEAHHAMVLLQYLVSEDDEPPEYQLILNKVLCGLEPNVLFDPLGNVSVKEQQECQHLLKAVITHATILNNMSMAGFRSTFLLRQGILRQRDGLWLLQVERQTYDVVLERFPWTFTLVKLPWMEKPLQVEWS